MPRAKLRRFFRHGLFPQLIVFEAVARLGSVTRAAEELHLAQPTVSMQMKKLADVLDVRLFEHRGRHLQLTAGGEAVRELCLEMFALLMRAEARLAEVREAPLLHAYNSLPTEEDGEWSSRANTTRR